MENSRAGVARETKRGSPNPARRTMLRIGLASALGPGVHFCFADFLTADPGSIHVVHNDAAVAARLRVPQYHSLRCAFTTFAHKRLLCCRNLCNMSALPDRSTEAAKHLRTRTHTRSTPAFILLPTLLQFFNNKCSCFCECNMQNNAKDSIEVHYVLERVRPRSLSDRSRMAASGAILTTNRPELTRIDQTDPVVRFVVTFVLTVVVVCVVIDDCPDC